MSKVTHLECRKKSAADPGSQKAGLCLSSHPSALVTDDSNHSPSLSVSCSSNLERTTQPRRKDPPSAGYRSPLGTGCTETSWWGWGDGSAVRTLAVQSGEPEFESPAPRPSMAARKPQHSGRQRLRGSWNFLVACLALTSVRDLVLRE